MEEKAIAILNFLSAIEPLKYVTRHSWCSNGRQESVADHSWRLAVMAISVEDEFPELDMKKVVKMCLLHDLGEIDGDVPAFKKTKNHDMHEASQLKKLTQKIAGGIGEKISSLHDEFNRCETPESRLANALDKLEALIQHNDADITTWNEIEYDLNLTYGTENTEYHPFLKMIRALVKRTSIEKIKAAIEIA